MRVLVVGAGGREHAIAWRLRSSPGVTDLLLAPGNAGTAQIATNLPIEATDLPGLLEAARSRNVDMTVVGPEAPLAAGIVDLFREHGLRVVGPTRAAARIESSKSYAKELMARYGIPTARSWVFHAPAEARAHVAEAPMPLVVKADGLTAGKGVTVCHSREEALRAISACMEERVYGDAGASVLVEEYLEGQEVSVFAFTDGVHISPLVAACDYKRLLEGNEGPNTGGLGSYSPPRFWSEALNQEVEDRIVRPVLEALSQEGHPYQGALYAGLMLTESGPKVLEFNCRLGDPEAQVVLPRLASDFLDVLTAVADGTLDWCPVEWTGPVCTGVVLASEGYPQAYRTGHPVSGLDNLDSDAWVFHAGTRQHGAEVVTAGGRVLMVVGQGNSLEEAREHAYRNVERVHFSGAYYRRDIGA